MTPSACRLWFVIAKESPVAALLRIEPEKQARLIRWNLEDDTFEPGAQVEGRVYETACDVCPDGKLFAYSAIDEGGAYLAVSRLPYFTPLARWNLAQEGPAGSVFLNRHGLRADTPSRHPQQGSLPGWFDLFRASVDAKTLQTWHGWQPNYRSAVQELFGTVKDEFFKPFGEGKILRDLSGKTSAHRFEKVKVAECDCADVDGAGRLVYSRGGQVFAFDAESGTHKELADFTTIADPEDALPDWAASWL
jgi:hypothetical protein